MKSSLRPTSVGDLGAVCQFLQRAFNARPDAPFLDPATMAWKYWERRDDWEGPRGYVLERDGGIVAHLGIYPMIFGAPEARGIQMIDWASARESPGAGLALLQKLVPKFDFLYSIGGSEMTRKILPGFGFVEYARQWNGARPLRPFRQILQHQHRNWKLAPRLTRNYLWSWSKSRVDPDWEYLEIGASEVSDNGDARFSPRPPAFFEYLLRCPATQVRLFGIRYRRELQGHFALSVMRGQARVAGVWLRDPGPQTWQSAFALAQQAASRIDEACEVVAAGTEGESEQAAAASGFRIIGHTPVYLLNKTGKLTLPADFQFQLADEDGVFRDTGRASYWT